MMARAALKQRAQGGWPRGGKNAAGAVLATVIALVMTPVLFHTLGAASFGFWSFLTTILNVAASLGIEATTGRFVASAFAAGNRRQEVYQLGPTLLRLVLAASALLVLGMLALTLLGAGAFAKPPLRRSDVALGLMLTAGALPAASLRSMWRGVCVGTESYGRLSMLTVLTACAMWVPAAIVAKGGGSLVPVVIATSLASWFTALIAWTIARPLARLQWTRQRPSRALRARVLQFASGSAVISVAEQSFSTLDKVVVSAILGPENLGYYALVTSIAGKGSALVSTLWQPLMPRSAVVSQSNNLQAVDHLRSRVVSATTFSVVGLVMAVAGTWLLAPAALSQWIGRVAAGQIVWPLVVGVGIYGAYPIAAPAYAVLLGAGRIWFVAAVSIASASLALFCIAVGAQRFGLTGAVSGNAGYLGILILVPIALIHLQQLRGLRANSPAVP